MATFWRWVGPGMVFTVALAFAACGDAANETQGGGTGGSCTPGASSSSAASSGSATSAAASTGGGGGAEPDGGPDAEGGTWEPLPGGLTTGDDDNTFDHFNDPGESGQKDPFEILKERAEEGPPEIRTRLHSCTKLPYSTLGRFLASRGVDLAKTSNPPSAGQLYKNGGDALGVARYDAREGETYFHTTAGATKLFDIFVQAAPEIIANIGAAPACKVNGVGHPMFDPMDGSCVKESVTCVLARPAKPADVALCNLVLSEANKADPADLANKQRIAVATLLSAGHTCE